MHLTLTYKKIFGFTLIEVMIALVLNIILFLALISIFVGNLKHYRVTLSTNRLNEQMQSAMQLMSNDIRRAGYSATASNDVGTHLNTNPFMSNTTDVTITNSNCILFAYDNSSNGTLPTISNSYDDERYGFRLQNNAIQVRPPGAPFVCNASASSWENMTDPTIISISVLTFTLNQQTITVGSGTRGIQVRSVDITMTGSLVSDPTITKTLTQHVRIRNDKFIP